MNLRLAVVTTVLLMPLAVDAASPPRQPNAGELARAVERLNVVGNVLYIAAHPDDENTRLLAYLANEKLLRTAYLSVTRGDGGQNLLGSEQGPLLGLIRTQELLAARRIDGAEQFFTRARDFGYSKTPDETLAIWDRAQVLADMVWVIRRFKPDVIITRFSPKATDTHGHHTASALLAEEAFKAAADPDFHPEQVQLTGVWQAKRLVWNKGLFNARPNEDLSAFFKLDVGSYNPQLGVSYGEMAADSRSMHKSQGFGAARSRGEAFEYFQVLAGAPIKRGLFDDVDARWSRVHGAEKLSGLFARARAELKPDAPHTILPLLLDALAELDALPATPWKEPKQHELVELIAACAGLFAEVNAADFSATPGGELAVTATLVNRSPAALTLDGIALPGGPINKTDKAGQPLANGQPVKLDKTIIVPADAPYSDPYWLADPPGKGLYTVANPALIGTPENAPSLEAELLIGANGRRFGLKRPIAYKWTDPVAGERHRPIEIVPPVTLNPAAPVLMFPDAQQKTLRVLVKASVAHVAGTLAAEMPAGWKAEPASLPFKLESKGAEAELTFHLTPPAGASTGVLHVVAEVDGKRLSRGIRRIEYPHIPIQTLFPPSEVKLVRFELKKGKLHLGYIPGAGDEVPAALEQAGYQVTLLGDELLRSGALGRFDAIITGVRAFNTNPRLPFLHAKLMEYVKAGGTLLVQYNTNNWISKLPSEIGPYPFEIAQDRVTDETAAVVFETPVHAALQHPNRIGAADFEGWVQERGLYFAAKWAAEYQPLLSMHDPGESAKKGSLLYAKYGKGTFVYTGLAFFRQLPAGVPGAFRLFANLLSNANGQ